MGASHYLRQSARGHLELSEQLKRVVLERTRRAVRGALTECGYCLDDPVRHRISIWFDREPGVAGKVQILGGHGQNGSPLVIDSGRLLVTVPETWYCRVFQPGLAIVDGCFVLAVLTEQDIRYRKLLAKRGQRAPDPWWVRPFGEEPNLSAGPHVLVIRHDGQGNARAIPMQLYKPY